MRFLFIGPDDALGEFMKEKRDDGVETSTERPSKTLIELLYGGYPGWLDRLRRPKGVRGPGTWQNDPEGFERYMDEGDWRNPGRLARPEPVNYYGRWVE
jgi:hypothetical protein